MSNMDPHPAIMNITNFKDKINRSAERLGKTNYVFRGSSISAPQYTCYEAGFLKSISWLYTLYEEVGKINVAFLLSRFDNYGLDPDDYCKRHLQTVYNLRTILQHSLDLRKERNADILVASENWFIRSSGVRFPVYSIHWKNCLESILQEASILFSKLLECVNNIEQDEFLEAIINEWNFRCSRFHAPEEFDRLILIVAADLGMDHIDPVKVRNRYYDVWMRDFAVLRGDYDFEKEARRRIESVLLTNPVLPITSQEIMTEFQIEPGPKLGKILSRAQDLYRTHLCNAEELLELIHNELQE